MSRRRGRRYRGQVLRLRIAVAAGRLAGFASRLAGRGGSALPGLVAEKICPRVIEKLAESLRGRVVVVTGTNGKTTTTKMLVAAMEQSGLSVLTNSTGSNLARGVATALIGATRRGRVAGYEHAVFEVDEAAVRTLGPRLEPELIVVTNLARDQLDRYGELDTTAAHVGIAVAASRRAVLNADDPAVTELDDGRTAWFGAVADIRNILPHDRRLYGPEEPSAPKAECDATLRKTAPSGDGQLVGIALGEETLEGQLLVPGAYNAYNATAAVLASAELGLDPGAALAALSTMPPAFGRGQILEFRQRRIRLLLVKNPAGFNQALRLLVDEPDTADVLFAINDNHADGRDVSWLWDVRFEDLTGLAHRVGTSGLRAADMALRLKYAGVDAWSDADLDAALERVVGSAPIGGIVYVVPTYTAMLDLLRLLLPDTPRAEAWS